VKDVFCCQGYKTVNATHFHRREQLPQVHDSGNNCEYATEEAAQHIATISIIMNALPHSPIFPVKNFLETFKKQHHQQHHQLRAQQQKWELHDPHI
jgi:hypothetical protein